MALSESDGNEVFLNFDRWINFESRDTFTLTGAEGVERTLD